MGELDGTVAIITGAASGIGREHALLFASEGASVVAADLSDPSAVVAEITATGGQAVGLEGDCADWATAQALLDTALSTYGRLDTLVNNAGGGSQALAADLTESAWDHEIRINLKVMFSPTRVALGHWKAAVDRGEPVRASVISTSSGAGLLGNVGQSPYGAAKAGVAAFTVIAAAELAGSGIRLNAIAPAARTPASVASSEMLAEFMRAPDDERALDRWHARNASPLVAYLATRDCPISGQVFLVSGGLVGRYEGWTIGETLETDHNLGIAELRALIPDFVDRAPDRSLAGGQAYTALRRSWQERDVGDE